MLTGRERGWNAHESARPGSGDDDGRGLRRSGQVRKKGRTLSGREEGNKATSSPNSARPSGADRAAGPENAVGGGDAAVRAADRDGAGGPFRAAHPIRRNE